MTDADKTLEVEVPAVPTKPCEPIVPGMVEAKPGDRTIYDRMCELAVAEGAPVPTVEEANLILWELTPFPCGPWEEPAAKVFAARANGKSLNAIRDEGAKATVAAMVAAEVDRG